MYSRKSVEEANIKLSKELASKYNETEPHYRPENKKIVSKKLKELQEETKGTKLLDIGCGTGFIIDLAKKYFIYIYGIDISQEMLNKVETKSTKSCITLTKTSSENTGFTQESFDVVTAYSVLHHLHSIITTLKEAYRVLRPGGIFYSSLDPNYYFNEALADLGREGVYSDLIERERIMLIERQDDKLFKEAEPLKYTQGGFTSYELKNILKEIGFKKIEITPYWFLGERDYVSKPKEERVINEYLKKIEPLSENLFKYLSIKAVK